MSGALPLGIFWFLYMGGMGVVFPYQSLYFRENAELAGAQVGLVLAMRPLVGMLAQPLWGQLADRSGARGPVLAALALGTALAYGALAKARGFQAILAATALAALFSTSVMPMLSAVSMAALGDGSSHRFGRLRVWGTLGFLVLVLAFPPLLHRAQACFGWSAGPDGPSEPGLGLIFVTAAVLSFAAAASALRLPRAGAMTLRARRGDLGRLLRHGPYRRVLVFTFCAFLFLQGPMLLFPIFVRSLGGSLDTVSALWIPMLALEIPLILLSGASLRRIGARGLLVVGVAADGLRWLGSALAPELWMVFVLQLLHGVVVAGLLVGVQLYVEAVVPERLRATGQSVVAMLGISLGGVLSSALGGWLLDAYGASAPYLVGGSAALLLAVAAAWLLPPPVRQAVEA